MSCKSEKWQWCYNLTTWLHRQIFWLCFNSLVKFSYSPKFPVNIIASSEVMTIFFYKGLTRNPEIRNTRAWVLPNIWRLRQVKDTKFGTNVSNKMLLNAAKCQGCSFYHFGVIKGNPKRRRRVRGWGGGSYTHRLGLNFVRSRFCFCFSNTKSALTLNSNV